MKPIIATIVAVIAIAAFDANAAANVSKIPHASGDKVVDSCAIDIPTNNSKFTKSTEFIVGGWIFTPAATKSAGKVEVNFISLDNKGRRHKTKSFTALVNIRRPDVAIALHDQTAEMSGYNVVIPGGVLNMGKYKIELFDGTYTCAPGHGIEILE